MVNKVFIPGKLSTILSYFNPALSGIGKFLLDEPNLSRQAGQIIFNFDDFKVVMVYGLINPDFPSKLVKNEFVLDYDCISSSVECNKIYETLDQMHDEIIRLFEKSITDKLRKKMELKDDEKF